MIIFLNYYSFKFVTMTNKAQLWNSHPNHDYDYDNLFLNFLQLNAIYKLRLHNDEIYTIRWLR